MIHHGRPVSIPVRRWAMALPVVAAIAFGGVAFNVAQRDAPDFPGACDEGNPYLVTTCYLGLAREESTRPYTSSWGCRSSTGKPETVVPSWCQT